jgi:LuxR family transcriptional regulator, maltose regulon positive regulatory protein
MEAKLFLLKTAPPRVGRALPTRPRLEQRWTEACDRSVIVVTAPQGFGKTTLLAQWRRRWLERGAYVAWVSLDALDDRAQFVNLLLFALRAATGRESFATASMQNRLQENQELAALTALLAEVAALATPTVIVLDDAHRMPQATLRELLSYLLNNAPPNLQFLVGSRRPLELQLGDLMASGRLASVTGSDLRFSLEESLEFLRGRFGSRVGLDDAVRLHELTEGWPLGLQLAAAAVERAADLPAVIRELSGRRGDIQRYFLESLISRLPQREADFLVRIAILELFNADLCAAVTGLPDAASMLDTVVRESAVVTEAEDREWFRLHALARDFLLGQFDRLPVEERRACYERAAEWHAAHGQLQEAARHAWAAGNETMAVDYAASSLRDIAREGRLGEARDWMKRLPATVMSRDVRLQLTAAWIRAMGDGPESVPELIERIRKHPQFDSFCAFESALISAAAANFCDKPGLVAEALDGIGEPPSEGVTALHRASLANSKAIMLLQAGDTVRARQILDDSIASVTREPLMRLPFGFSDLAIGLSHLWEGNPVRAAEVLQPRLEASEREMGRRSVVAAVLSGAFSAALYLQDSMEAALAVLADRLDVIERAGMPDPIILAYRVLATGAARHGDERRALDVLQSMHEFGVARGIPRLRVASLAEQARIHVAAARVETATEIVAAMAALRPTFERPEYRPFLRMFDRRLAIADASVRLVRQDAEGAEAVLASARDVPAHLRFNPDALIHRALSALAAHQRGQGGAREQLSEVLSLADIRGMRRFVEESHPGLAGLLGHRPERPVLDAPPTAGAMRAAATGPGVQTASSGLLTPKEASILSLLASGMANKEIARAMDIGEQTVKWHLKNVFFKLNAASRRHAVDRARVLGLLSA